MESLNESLEPVIVILYSQKIFADVIKLRGQGGEIIRYYSGRP